MFYIFHHTASATVEGPMFVRAEHSATDEGENCACGPTLQLPLLLSIINS
jgi:hypothetical protein